MLLLKDIAIWKLKNKTISIETDLELDSADTSIKQKKYKRLVKKLQWLIVMTRPDIIYVVSKLASIVNASSTMTWKTFKWILRYLKETMDWSLRYCGSSFLTGYSDAN